MRLLLRSLGLFCALVWVCQLVLLLMGDSLTPLEQKCAATIALCFFIEMIRDGGTYDRV